MKKTIAAILALAACAQAVELVASFDIKEDGIKVLNASGEEMTNGVTLSGVSGNSNVTLGDGFFTTTEGATTPSIKFDNVGLNFENSVSVCFTATFAETTNKAYPGVFCIGEDARYSYLGFTNASNNTYTFGNVGKGGYSSDVTAITNTHASLAGTHDFDVILETLDSDTNSRSLTLRMDGEIVYKGTMTQDFGQPSGVFFNFAGSNQQSGTQCSSMTVSNVKFYSGAVPEPATATLSLLALAGLAARRRRH